MIFIRKHITMFLLALLVVAVLLISTVAYQVEFTEKAVVMRFGKTVRTIDGSTDAGLKWKLPWPAERLVKYDARSHLLEGSHSQIQTRDGHQILVTLYCSWKIEDAARFHETAELVDKARNDIKAILTSAKNDFIPKYQMADLINTDPTAVKIDEILARIHAKVAERASEAYGVDVQLVGIRRIALPEGASASVIDTMTAERQRYISQYQAEGMAKAEAIRQRARSAADMILAFAQRKAESIRAEGDGAAAVYYGKFQENPGLSMFLRSLESLKKELSGKSVFLLTGSELPAIKYFRDGPSVPDFEVKAVKKGQK